MKKTNNVFRMLAAGISVMSVLFMTSCQKDMRDRSVQANSADNSVSASAIAQWGFDSSWTESVQKLKGKAHNGARFSTTGQAQTGKAAFFSKDSGYVTYANAGTALPNLSSGFTVSFWVYASGKEGGAQCIWCLPQTGAFWPTQHVLLDGYNSAKKDTGLIKIMFKANKGVPYDEEWTEVGNIPKFYNRWSHIQYAYNGTTSEFTIKVNGKTYVDHQVKYDSDPTAGGQPLGNINANPGTHGIVFGAFQNTTDPALFGDPQVWMLPFKGRIDAFKVYGSAQF